MPTAVEPFPAKGGARIVGVNSFGFGGANAHVLLTEAPSRAQPEHLGAHANRAWPLVLSARSEEALRSSALRLSAWLDARSNANGDSPILPDLAYTLGARRNHHPYRVTLAARSIGEVISELNGYAEGQKDSKVRMGFAPRRTHLPRVAFVMSGQGPQWWGMGRDLFQHEPVFQETIERCDSMMRPWGSFSLMEELGRPEEASQMHRTEIAQPAIFAMQVALARLWKSWGVQPAAIVGHSVGEVAAACVAGVLSLEEAARVIVLRARFMDDCARNEGTMLAIGLGEDAARALIARHDRTLTIAAFNGPRSLTIAGSRLSLEAIAAEAGTRWSFCTVRAGRPPLPSSLDAARFRGLGRSVERFDAEGRDGRFFQHRDRPAVRGRGMRRRSLGERSAATGAVHACCQCVDGRGC